MHQQIRGEINSEDQLDDRKNRRIAIKEMNRIKVDLGERSYPVFVGTGIINKLAEILALYGKQKKYVIITDEHVQKLYAGPLVKHLEKNGFVAVLFAVPVGEKSKSMKIYEQVLNKMTQAGVARDWAVIALGGGVPGDLAGFVAATYMRGLEFIQIPTSLLAQVDSSVGGKVGINLDAGKNLLGAFYQPKFVWIDTDFLKTLDGRDVISGLAEVIKYGIIRDPDFFMYCEKQLSSILNLQSSALIHIIALSCTIKAAVVKDDEKEHGVRAILNFGHTIGHAIEACFGYKKIRHGEALLWGMLIEARMAWKLKILPVNDFERIKKILLRVPLKVSIASISIKDLLPWMKVDKKVVDASIRYILPTAVGTTTIVKDIREDVLQEALSYAVGHCWLEECS